MAISLLLILVFFGALVSAFGGILLKIGADQIGSVNNWYDLLGVIFTWPIIVGLLMYLGPVMLWIYLLRKVELTLLQPLLAMVYVITPILALLILNEKVSEMRWLGIAIIVAGVVVVARS